MSRLFCISKCIQQPVKISLCSFLYVTENSIVPQNVFRAIFNLLALVSIIIINEMVIKKIDPHYKSRSFKRNYGEKNSNLC